MTQMWLKLGRIWFADGSYDWMISHTTAPSALYLGDSKFRIYFNSRNRENKSQPGYIDIKFENQYSVKVINVSERPVLKLGDPGLFDDAAIFAQSFVKRNELIYMYYNGWMRGVSVPYYTSIGLAISKDGGLSFNRYSPAPILCRSKIDPYGTGSPWVIYEDGIWRMWYLSIVRFGWIDGNPMYYYHIKYAESEDGIHWDRRGIVAIDFEHPGETRIARPCVIYEDGIYKMWYCYAIGLGGYKIGYAESEDGIKWIRKDDDISFMGEVGDWDRGMMAYPFVFKYRNRKYMIYSGNEYGKGGMGLAILKE